MNETRATLAEIKRMDEQAEQAAWAHAQRLQRAESALAGLKTHARIDPAAADETAIASLEDFISELQKSKPPKRVPWRTRLEALERLIVQKQHAIAQSPHDSPRLREELEALETENRLLRDGA